MFSVARFGKEKQKQDAWLNLNFRSTIDNFLVEVLPKYFLWQPQRFTVYSCQRKGGSLTQGEVSQKSYFIYLFSWLVSSFLEKRVLWVEF